MKRHFFANRRPFFLLAALLPPLDAVDTLLKGAEHFAAQGPLYVIFLAIVFALCVVAARVRDSRFHGFFAVFFLAYLLAFIGVNLRVLG